MKNEHESDQCIEYNQFGTPHLLPLCYGVLNALMDAFEHTDYISVETCDACSYLIASLLNDYDKIIKEN